METGLILLATLIGTILCWMFWEVVKTIKGE